MKKALAYSLILHLILVSLAVFLVIQKREEKKDTFTARIVSPEELDRRDAPDTGSREVRPAPEVRKDTRVVPSVPSKPSVKRQERTGKKESRPARKPEKETPVARRPSLPRTAPPSEAFRDTPSRPSPPSAGKPAVEPDRAGTPGHSGPTPPSREMTPREKLFDREVLAKLSKPEKESPKPAERPITFETKDFKYYGYMKRLREKIEGIWKYPVSAQERGIYGDLYIQFTIRKNGKLGAVELMRTSGHKELDDAALRALRDADPFWPLPDDWDRESFTITGHFIYSLYGPYIR